MGKITYNEIEELKDIKYNLLKELIEYGKKDGKLQEIDTLSHSIKNLCKIIEDVEMELGIMGEFSGRYANARGGGQGGSSGYYAGDGYSMHGIMNGYPYMMPEYAMAQGGGGQGGSSGARRRDSMGRYSSGGDLVSKLYSLMESAKDERERQELSSFINRLEQ